MASREQAEEWEARLAYLERKIAAYPHWGAALTAMDEEARGLRRAIAMAERPLTPATQEEAMTRSLGATQTSARTATGSDLWCTPPEVLERVRRIGPIGLDPCTSDDNPTGARVWYTPQRSAFNEEDPDQLLSPGELVYANPPYSEMSQWAGLLLHYARTCGSEVIALVAARPDSRWFHTVAWTAQAVCFWKGRLRFVGAPSSAPFPSAVVYHGARPWAFEAAFHDAGKVIRLR